MRSMAVDLDVARPAMAEMRRSVDQMQLQHQAQMDTMSDQAKAPMMAMMHDMERHLGVVSANLALETEM